VFKDLYKHMRWADGVIWKAVGSTDDPRVRDLLAHLHMTERAFLKTWRGEQFERDLEIETIPQILAWATKTLDEIAAFIDTVDFDDIDRPMIMPWAKRFAERSGLPGAADTTFRDTLLQLPMHSTYHRGQINARLRELGVDPPLTDYIAWCWFGRP
jgi:uncharacterized damage-inducible protein DinB